MAAGVLAPAQALRVARILWATLLLGPIALAVVAVLRRRGPGPPAEVGALAWAAIGATVLALVLAPRLRAMLWARGRRGEVVEPSKWLAGHVVAWALYEGAGMLGWITVLLGAPKLATVSVPAIALLAQFAAFPRGGELEAPSS
jgi:hypothetical protein